MHEDGLFKTQTDNLLNISITLVLKVICSPESFREIAIKYNTILHVAAIVFASVIYL